MSIDKSKILVNISQLEDIDRFKEAGISHFLFPLEDFSVGYRTFSLEEIEKTKADSYILVNRLLNDEDIDKFLKLDLPENIKGAIIEDIGLFYALKDQKIEKINFQNHLNNNYKTVNYWLNYYDSLVLSTDITLEEGMKIIDEANKPIIVYSFGYPLIMYSRRTLLSNYHESQGSPTKSQEQFSIPGNETAFILRESKYGTVVFPSKPLDLRSEVLKFDADKVKFYFFDSNMIDVDIIISAINGEDVSGFDKGFMYKKTVYRVGDLK